jgi:hypothetical protein
MQKLASGEQVIKVNGDTIATQGQLAKLFLYSISIHKVPILLIMVQSQDDSY